MDRDNISIQTIIGVIFVIAALAIVPAVISVMTESVDNQVSTKSLVEEASYIIYKDGDYSCLKNGTTSRIEARSTNASYVLQYAIDNLIGGEISVRAGNYEIDYPVNFTHAVTLSGEGCSLLTGSDGEPLGTHFYINSSIDAFTIDLFDYQSGVVLKDFGVYGNGAGLTAINASGMNRAVISNIYINSFTRYGISLSNVTSTTISDCHIYNCGTTSPYLGGLIVGEYSWAHLINVYSSQFEWCGSGIIVRSSGQALYSGCSVEGNKYHGIFGWSGSGHYAIQQTVESCWFELNNLAHGTNISDVHLIGSSGYWSINNCQASGTFVNNTIFVGPDAWYANIHNHRSYHEKILYKSPKGSISNIGVGDLDDASFPLHFNVSRSGPGWVVGGAFCEGDGHDVSVVYYNFIQTPTMIILTPGDNDTSGMYVRNITATSFEVHYIVPLGYYNTYYNWVYWRAYI